MQFKESYDVSAIHIPGRLRTWMMMMMMMMVVVVVVVVIGMVVVSMVGGSGCVL